MVYNNEKVRRQDRLLDEERAREILRKAEYGVMSMVTADGRGYGVPLNYVWDGGSSIYIHCAPEGEKLAAIRQNPTVSFCVVGMTHLLPERFTTEYESVVMRCNAVTGLDDDERRKALRLIVDKLSPEYRELGMKYSEKSFHRVDIIRLDIIEASGKRKYVGR